MRTRTGTFLHADNEECLWGATDQKWWRIHPLYPLRECEREHPARGDMIDLYIAGPMTGLAQMNFPAFMEAEEKLQAAGFTTSNPARHGARDPDLYWVDYMRRDIPELLRCRSVAVLPNWTHSKGASLEVRIAKSLDMEIRYVDEWVNP